MQDDSTQRLIDFVIQFAVNRLHPRQIILFGSRARGDAHQYSDFDMAFDFDPVQYQREWGSFCVELTEQAPTLLPMDLVNMSEISDEFKAKIHSEGVIIYNKDKK